MSYQSWKCRFNWHVAKVQVKLARGQGTLKPPDTNSWVVPSTRFKFRNRDLGCTIPRNKPRCQYISSNYILGSMEIERFVFKWEVSWKQHPWKNAYMAHLHFSNWCWAIYIYIVAQGAKFCHLLSNRCKTKWTAGSSMCVRVSWHQPVCPWEAGAEAISCDIQVYQVLYALAPLKWRI